MASHYMYTCDECDWVGWPEELDSRMAETEPHCPRCGQPASEITEYQIREAVREAINGEPDGYRD